MSGNVNCGFAETDITPESIDDIMLVGFPRADNHARGILHRLIAQALVFERGGQWSCLIAVDSIGFTTELTLQLRQAVGEILGQAPDKVMVCFSHTHAAPDAVYQDVAYFHFACGRILEAVKQAQSKLFPARAAWGIAENTIGVIRLAGGELPDKRMGVLKIGDGDKTRVLVLRLAAHANVLTADNYLISSDYYGVTRAMIEARFGCKVIITQGAAGDVRAKYRQQNADLWEERPLEAAQAALGMTQADKDEMFRQSMEALERNAREITQAVDKVFHQLTPAPISRLAMRSEIHTFYSDVPTEARAASIAQQAMQEAQIDGAAWLAEVRRLRTLGVKMQKSEREIQCLCINEGCLCGTPDEPMSEIALMAAEAAGNLYLFLGGYTNGIAGYLPSAQAYDAGGYEVLWSNLWLFGVNGRVMPFHRDSAERLALRIKDMWEQLRAE